MAGSELNSGTQLGLELVECKVTGSATRYNFKRSFIVVTLWHSFRALQTSLEDSTALWMDAAIRP